MYAIRSYYELLWIVILAVLVVPMFITVVGIPIFFA